MKNIARTVFFFTPGGRIIFIIFLVKLLKVLFSSSVGIPRATKHSYPGLWERGSHQGLWERLSHTGLWERLSQGCPSELYTFYNPAIGGLLATAMVPDCFGMLSLICRNCRPLLDTFLASGRALFMKNAHGMDCPCISWCWASSVVGTAAILV